MVKIYKDFLKGTSYFSGVYSYLFLCINNKGNFLQKRNTKKLKLFDNCKKSIRQKNQRNILDENNKKKNIVLYFPTNEISYFYYHYLLYILLPQLQFIKDEEKKQIVNNVYLINENLKEEIQNYIFNKINRSDFSIIFAHKILPPKQYDYNNTFVISLENKHFLDLFLPKKNKHKNGRVYKKVNTTHIAKEECENNSICSALYSVYFSHYTFQQRAQLVRRRLSIEYPSIKKHLENINTNILWYKHYSFYKFYEKAYISFFTYRMFLFANTIETIVKRKNRKRKRKIKIKITTEKKRERECDKERQKEKQQKEKSKNTSLKNITLYTFYKLKKGVLNSKPFFDFIKQQVLFMDFKKAFHLYVTFMFLLRLAQSDITHFEYNKESRNYYNDIPFLISDKNFYTSCGKRNINKQELKKEIQKNLHIYIWEEEQKKQFYSALVNVKFRKFYN